MRPRATAVAELSDHRLVFDLPVGPGERGVANLLPVAGDRVVGVAYEIDGAQAHRLDRSEGVPRAYRRASVELAAEGGPIAAFTYVSPHRAPERKPSRRYLGLLLHGARHHGLPAEWIAHLRGLELARDERDPQRELF